MKFSTAFKLLIETKKIVQITDYDFNKSYYEYTQRGKVKKLFDFQYLKQTSQISKTGKRMYKNINLPVYSSNDDHPYERGDQRVELNVLEVNSAIKKALLKIRSLGLKEGGYRIESASLDLVLPLLIYKNIDTIDSYNSHVFIKGRRLAPQDFIEHPEYFVEIRTILNKDMYGVEYIKIYSNPDEMGVLAKHTEVLIEQKISSFITIKI